MKNPNIAKELIDNGLLDRINEALKPQGFVMCADVEIDQLKTVRAVSELYVCRWTPAGNMTGEITS
jgi:hypothetical protein